MQGYNFTERVRQVLATARETASEFGHEYVSPDHILLGLLYNGGGVAPAVLKKLGVDRKALAADVETRIGEHRGAHATGPDLPFTSRAKKALELSMDEARRLKHSYVGTEHVLIALMRDDGSATAKTLTTFGAHLDTVRGQTVMMLGTELPADGMEPTRDLMSIAKAYLKAIEARVTGHELGKFFTRDVVQDEFPNKLLPSGARRDLAAILDAAARGQSVLESQHFSIQHGVANGDAVALQVKWTGKLKVSVAGMAAGEEIRARFAMFLLFRNGKIARQANYDCFY